MKKYIILWITSTLIIAFILFQVTSFISNTHFSNVFSVFEIMLALIGFATTMSTMITCTKLIIDKINNLQ